jgi:hypothetical protein
MVWRSSPFLGSNFLIGLAGIRYFISYSSSTELPTQSGVGVGVRSFFALIFFLWWKKVSRIMVDTMRPYFRRGAIRSPNENPLFPFSFPFHFPFHFPFPFPFPFLSPFLSPFQTSPVLSNPANLANLTDPLTLPTSPTSPIYQPFRPPKPYQPSKPRHPCPKSRLGSS